MEIIKTFDNLNNRKWTCHTRDFSEKQLLIFFPHQQSCDKTQHF